MPLTISFDRAEIPEGGPPQSRYDQLVHNLTRRYVYDAMPSVALEDAPPTTTLSAADALFRRIRGASVFRASKVNQKLQDWRNLVYAAARANWLCGCIQYRRNRTFTRATMLQVIACAVEAALLLEHRSPPGSPRMSRLIPLYELQHRLDCDPWEFEPLESRQLVFLFSRGTAAEELDFDPEIPVAAETQRHLEVVNATNSLCKITYRPTGPLGSDVAAIRRLRPIHVARFTDHWGWHGRLYTSKYGHQALKKAERQTIEFDGGPSAELDYSAMHPRLLYHRLGIDYTGDPYALWGAQTTAAQRLLAKIALNAAINARSPTAAVAACNHKTRLRTETGAWKQGRALEKARQLLDALQSCQLSFQQIHALVRDLHAPIAHFFGSDMGMKLMRVDGAIALDVLFHFAEQGIPALGCHDSFLVPASYADELEEAMLEFYRERVGHYPVIKREVDEELS